MALYEVRCHRCNVSFPPGTRVCLHCGGRTGESRAPVALTDISTFERVGNEESLRMDPEAAGEMPADDEVGSARRTVLGTIMNMLWVVLLIGGYLFHTCSGGSE